jgi:endonuclease/exonuclease/phosphatase family metal-dependent hydrolase
MGRALSGVTLLLALLTCARADAADELTLRVVSYNVWGVPHISPDRPGRIAEIAAQLARMDVDIVALQEVWLDEDAEVIGAALAEAGLTHQHHFGATAADPGGSGLWIGSRYPFDEASFERFAVGDKVFIPWHLDWMTQKGVAVVRVRTPLGVLGVANTHLQASYLYTSYRFVQLSQAMQMANLLTEERAPLVATGDLNVSPDSVPFRVLAARAVLEPASDDLELEAVLARDGDGLHLERLRFERRLTEPVRLKTGKERLLSDHPCLVTDYRLSACASCVAPAPTRWRTVAGDALRSLRAEISETRRVMHGGRVLCVALPLLGLWSARRAFPMRRRRAKHHAALAVLLFVFGGWLGYVGWEFAPYKLEVLATDAEKLADLDDVPHLDTGHAAVQ